MAFDLALLVDVDRRHAPVQRVLEKLPEPMRRLQTMREVGFVSSEANLLTNRAVCEREDPGGGVPRDLAQIDAFFQLRDRVGSDEAEPSPFLTLVVCVFQSEAAELLARLVILH